MQRIFNKDGFNWWIGVVENRQDPEKLGRCKVRIFGYHTDSKELLPTKDLPWCIPIQPITSAANSGIGSSPLGPVEGTWVIGFFLDGEDCQQPAMFGTISTKAAKQTFVRQNADATPRKETNNPNDGIVRDKKTNEPVKDEKSNPVKTAVPNVPGWELGKTSEKAESGGKGPGVINDYKKSAEGDLGGASYGVYQFASFLPAMRSNGQARPSSKNSPVDQYLSNSKFKDKFTGLVPATAEFDTMWKQVASSNTAEFREDQHDYVKRKYYNVMVSNLQRAGFDLTSYGPGVQDLIWSTAVQFGPARVKIFSEPLKNKSELSEKDIITLVSDYKINNVDEFFKSSAPNIRAGIKSRYQSEKQALLAMVKT